MTEDFEKAEALLPDVLMQMATQYRLAPVAGSNVFLLGHDWLEKAMEQLGCAQVVRSPAELEKIVDDESVFNIIIPNDAAMTTQSLEAVLGRHSATKNIFWGYREKP